MEVEHERKENIHDINHRGSMRYDWRAITECTAS